MERINCILCNIDNTTLLLKKKSFHVERCKRCGLVYLNPRLSSEELAKLYNTAVSNEEDLCACQSINDHNKHKMKKFGISIELLKKQKRKIDRILDVGCSTGIFLKMASDQGWTPYGSEVNASQVEVNRETYGERIKLQKGNRISFPDNHFDAVTLFDSIEHMPDPIDMLKEAARVLKKDGIIVISTPNIEGLFPRITHLLFCRTIGAWEHPTPPLHVFQFSKRTLKMALEEAGLEWIDCGNFEIHSLYTVRELENSIINVMKGNNTRDSKIETKIDMVNGENSVTKKIFLNNLKKVSRFLIRSGCWLIVKIVYPVARVFKSGDAMVVLAARKD